MEFLSTAKIFNYLYLIKNKIIQISVKIYGMKYVRYFSVGIILSNLLNWIFSYLINLKSGEDAIIFLHYNVDFGVNLIGDNAKIYNIPLLGLFVVILNMVIFLITFKESKFIHYILFLSGILVNFILFVSLLLIYLLNFNQL